MYKVKKNANREIKWYKARLVAKNYSQRAGIDYSSSTLGNYKTNYFLGSSKQVEDSSNGNDVCLFNWNSRRSLYTTNIRLQSHMVREQDVQRKAFYGLKQAPRA